jgi:hypothetical protein
MRQLRQTLFASNDFLLMHACDWTIQVFFAYDCMKGLYLSKEKV